jgi:hypothetical protein
MVMVQVSNPLAQAIAALQLSLRSRQQDRTTSRPAPGSAKRSVAGHPAGPSKVATLAAGLAAINPADPHRPRKAIRAFIEATLQDEFGSALIMSADFQATVDRTVDALFADPSLAKLIDAAVAELGAGPATS